MKKFAFSVVAFIFILALISCGGGGKYAEATKLMEKQSDLMSSFAEDMNSAANAADAAKAIDNFREGMEKIMPEYKNLEDKYPELKTQKEEDMPAEIKPVMDKMMKEVMPKFAAAMGKMQQYMNDPAVQEAYKKMNESMAKNR